MLIKNAEKNLLGELLGSSYIVIKDNLGLWANVIGMPMLNYMNQGCPNGNTRLAN